jgi:hypothetical protein
LKKIRKKAGPRNIELVSALKQLDVYAQRKIVPPKLVEIAQEEISQKIGQSKQHVERRLAGLRAEDEFRLMAILLGNVEQITPLVQKQLVNWTRYSVPDFLMSVRVPKQFVGPDRTLIQRLFVDVKTVDGNKGVFLLPVEMFDRLMTFSQLYQPIPLYFAIRMGKAGSPTWYLISSAALLKVSKKDIASVRGRKEDCLSSQLVELLLEDLSGIWLANYNVMVPKGFTCTIEYSDSGEGPVYDDKYGRLVRLHASTSAGKMVIEFQKGMDFKYLLLQEILRRLQVGEIIVEELPGGRKVICKCDVNNSVPFYWLVLDTYLDLREKFEPLFESSTANPTIDYLLDDFSDFDRNLAISIRNAIWKLYDDRLVVPIKMVPRRYGGEEEIEQSSQ